MSDEPELDLDRDAWEPQAPPSDFAERVLGRVRAEDQRAQQRRRSRRITSSVGVAALLAAAAVVVLGLRGAPSSHGAAIAKDRAEVSLGSRARAVLEPGADVTWSGDDVVQAHGDVFYRVEPGQKFRVHTPAGDVEVKGTCFAVKIRNEDAMNKRDVKSGIIGAGLSALAFVAVYEGKVAVSHAGSRADVAAGESARLGAGGTSGTGTIADGEKAFAASAASGASDTSLAQANDNLVAQVSEYRSRLEAIAAQKIELEQKLKKSEEKLAAADGGPGRTRPADDLTQEDWAALAKKGEIKYRRPCSQPTGWTLTPEQLDRRGLAPQDAGPLHDAYERSYQRLWAQLRPLCAAALGVHAEVADKIGLDSCTSLVHDEASKQDKDGSAELLTQVAEIRAGVRPEPPPGQQPPLMKMYLSLTSANQAFESDLAKSFGPEEAHRLAYDDGDSCTWTSGVGGGKKRGE